MFRLSLVALLLLAAPVAGWGEDVESAKIIALARSYLGGEEALTAIQAVRFSGAMETVEATPDGPRPLRATLEIVFQKPFRQRIELELPDRRETTALNDYEAWQRVERSEEGARHRLTLLGKDQIRRLRANTWENLAFFAGLAERGGRVEDRGPGEVDGRNVRKIAFIHSESIVFLRHFDVETGRLVLTETEKGGRIREEGEIRVNGVRFPSKIITTSKLADGSERTVTVSFHEIVANEPRPDAYFAVPPLAVR